MSRECSHPCCGSECRKKKPKKPRKPIKKRSGNLLLKAQEVFNAWIRERDKYKGCISCGGPVEQAGHYYPAGRCSALRFSEINVNGQCVECNCVKHGNLEQYHQGLMTRYMEISIWRIGERSTEVKKWSESELRAIIEKYREIGLLKRA